MALWHWALIRWHAADREWHSLLVAIPHDHHRDVFAHRRGGNQRGQIVRTETVHHSEGNTGAAISFEKNASATDADELGYISVA